jgi:hypothetical protein
VGKPWEIVVGDVRRVLRDMPSESFDACLSDPPYGISFGGNRWDYNIPSANVWVELLRVLKPGAYAMLFGGTRTFHRLMVAVEDAGFLPVDTCLWMHGKGFPKNLDLSKAIDHRLGAKRTNVVGHKNAGLDRGSGASVDFQGSKGRDETGLIPVMTPAPSQASLWDGQGTALKPSWEPIMLACKPRDGTYAENALKHGCGGLAIDASRISYASAEDQAAAAAAQRLLDPAPSMFLGDQPNSAASLQPYLDKQSLGRWPANLLIDEEVAPMLNGASRFYYVTKASREERDRGLEGTAIAERTDTEALGDGGRGKSNVHNDHPTIKPLDLCRYFARLLLPPPRADGRPRRIVIPYAGSGSECIGALQAGWDEVVGIELDPKHAEKARLRISKGKILQHVKK